MIKILVKNISRQRKQRFPFKVETNKARKANTYRIPLERAKEEPKNTASAGAKKGNCFQKKANCVRKRELTNFLAQSSDYDFP